MSVLQQCVFSGFKDHIFVREVIVYGQPEHHIRYSTDTWTNIFHLARWSYFTNTKHISLVVRYKGTGKLSVHCLDNTAQTTLLKSITLNSETEDEVKLELVEDADFYYFSWEEKQKGDLLILQARYETDNEQTRDDLKVAVVIPTFQRLDDIHNTLQQFCYFLDERRESGEKCGYWHLFVVNNDKNQSIEVDERHASNVTVIVNEENVGGSTAFAQGTQLAVKKEYFTHVLFMDDDAQILPECWRRTHAFLSHLLEKFWEHPISGAMLERENPNYCHALIEVQNKFLRRICLCGDKELDTADKCVEFLSKSLTINRELLEHPPHKSHLHPHAAWWYALYPVEAFKAQGYPEPYFFSGDDMEFSLRIGKFPIYLNGINIFHPNFANKKSKLRFYLSTRNYILKCKKHHDNWKAITRNFILRRALCCLAANDYEGCAIVLLAMKDSKIFNKSVLKFDDIKNKINVESSKWKNKEEVGEFILAPIPREPLSKNILPMALTLLSLGGALVPIKRDETIADLMQVGRRWASRKTACPGDSHFKIFQWKKAFLLSLTTLRFLIFSEHLFPGFTQRGNPAT